MNTDAIEASYLTRRDRLQKWWLLLDNAKQLYVAGMAMAVLFVVVVVVTGKGLPAEILFLTAVTSFAIAFLIEGYRWLIATLEAPAAKWLTAVGGVMAAALATGAASSTLAAATGQDPNAFKTATAFLAPMSFVPILAMLVVIGGVLGLPFFAISMFAKHGLTRGKPKDLDVLLSFGRLMGFAALVTAAAQLVSPSAPLEKGLEKAAGYSAYFLDMAPNRTCAPTEGDRVARINDSLVIIGRVTDDGLQFVRQNCAIAAEPTTLRQPAPIRGQESAGN